MKSFSILAGIALVVGVCQMALAQEKKAYKVLHLYGFGERPHGGAQKPVMNYLDELAQEKGIEVTHQKNSDVSKLEEYDVVLFNSTAFGAFTKPAEQEKIISWTKEGGKSIGFHSSCDIRGKWDWWGDVMCSGSWYDDDFFGAFTLNLDKEVDGNPAFKDMWVDNELGDAADFPKTELYVFNANPRGKEGVTMFHTVGKDFSDVPDHPFGWLKKIEKGEYIYSALGHQGSDFDNGWLKKATWAWIRYFGGEYDKVQTADGQLYRPFARFDTEKNSFHIKDEGRHTVRVFDLQGRILYNWQGSGEKMHEYQGLVSGIYFVQVKSENLNYSRRVTIF